MITSQELADFLREEIYNQQERLLLKQLCARMGYSRATISAAIHQGRFTMALLRRFAVIFPTLRQNPTFIDQIRRNR